MAQGVVVTHSRLTARRCVAMVAAAALMLGACSDGGSSTGKRETSGGDAPKATTTAKFTAFGSLTQSTVTGAPAGVELLVVNRNNRVVARGTTDDHGSLISYDLDPGDGYTVRYPHGKVVEATKPFRVLAPSDRVPNGLYKQHLSAGLNYVKMRDGIEIAVTVRLPAGADLATGQYPTVIEYSGYAVAAPHDLLASATAKLTNKDAKSDPLAPSTATALGSIVAPLIGFVSVSVQMRGSGCSGGAYDLFGLPTTYDGYDIVETVAAQPWVKGGKVGMVGISYSGISQLFVAGTKPPHLAAIAPFSVTEDLYRGVGYPGGIFNNGFAKSWLTERVEDAKPAPEGGQEWAKLLVAQGDEHCTANQLLHRQARNGLEILDRTHFRDPKLFRERTPGEWFSKSDVPTFLVGGVQDEQVSSHWMTMLDGLSKRPDTWVTIYNGRHADAVAPRVISRWIEFLNLFVGDRIPEVPGVIAAFSGALFKEAAGADAEALPANRFAGQTDVAAARAEFRKDPKFRLLMDIGAGPLGPGSLQPTWERTFDSWPPAKTEARRWYLAAGGRLAGDAPTDGGADTYTSNPAARPATDDDPKGPKPAYKDAPNNWTPLVDGDGLGYVTEPLGEDVMIAGASSLDLRVAASVKDADVQVTLSEVRPDGDETYVTAGWLRLSQRKLDAKRSTATDPVQTHLQKDSEPLVPDAVVDARIEIFPVVYAFRAGSRIRVTIQAPGGDQQLWKFQTIETGETKVRVELGGTTPSSLVLPVVVGERAGAPLPACGVLRGQPCRPYIQATNGG